jgi:hypothetical protein
MGFKDIFMACSSLFMAAALAIFLFVMVIVAIFYFGTMVGCCALLVLLIALVLAKGHARIGEYVL